MDDFFFDEDQVAAMESEGLSAEAGNSNANNANTNTSTNVNQSDIKEEGEEALALLTGKYKFRFSVMAISLYWWCLISCGVLHYTALFFFYHIL